MPSYEHRHKDWTPEEEDELIDLVLEQELTLLYDPRLAWFRISVQLDRIAWECRRHWLQMRARKKDRQLPCPYYEDVEGNSEIVLWYTKQDSCAQRGDEVVIPREVSTDEQDTG